METCKHIQFGADNYVETALLTSNRPLVTELDYIRNEYRGRQARWVDFSSEVIIIDGQFDTPKPVNFFSINGHNLPPEAAVGFQLFDGVGRSNANLVYSSPLNQVGEALPLGLWRAGINPFGDDTNEPLSRVLTHFLDDYVVAPSFRVFVRHGYTPSLAEPPPPPPPPAPNEPEPPPPPPEPIYSSDGIYRQGDNGVLSIEAENGVVTANGSDTWERRGDSSASGGVALYKNTADFYWAANEGPSMVFNFNASASGSHKVFARIKSEGGGNSLYHQFDGDNKLRIWGGNTLVNQGWQWEELRTVQLSANSPHRFSISARDRFMFIDKIVVQPSGLAAPSGTGPAESGFGVIVEQPPTPPAQSSSGGNSAPPIVAPVAVPITTSSDNISLRMLSVGTTLSLENNFSYGSSIKFLDEPLLRTTTSGFSVSARQQNLVRALSLNLDMMSDLDRLTLSSLERRRRGKPMLISPYPDRAGWFTSDYTFLARLSNALAYGHTFEDIHNTSMNFLEV